MIMASLPVIPRALLHCLLVVLTLLLPPALQAGSLRLDAIPDRPLGPELQVLPESGPPLGIARALSLARAGKFATDPAAAPSFGIGAAPVWLRLTLDNPSNRTETRHLVVGTTWIDHIDLYQVGPDGHVRHATAGDALPGQQRPLPGVGYDLRLELPPGRTDILLRTATPDPLLVPLQLMTEAGLRTTVTRTQYLYGMIYGFLLALFAYNAILWFSLRQPVHRDYALFLSCFTLMNIAYTGHGYAWLWPDHQLLQRFVILVLMLASTLAGLRFVTSFLELPRHMPRVATTLRHVTIGTSALMLAAVVLDRQRDAAVLAFSVMTLCSFGMVAIGVVAARLKLPASRYFLTAASCGLTGVLVTALTVWGLIPYSPAAFHAAELGVLMEASLLALAVAYLVRQHEQARHQAERQAQFDSLTGLYSRRHFTDIADACWSQSRRQKTALSVILLDIDHFRAVNDQHGNAAGDAALREAAALIKRICRHQDIAARWGGEEFILLLPDTHREEAQAMAEQLRKEIARRPVGDPATPVWLQVSVGVASRDRHFSLEELIHEADTWLQRAKQNGCNQVCSVDTVFSSPNPG